MKSLPYHPQPPLPAAALEALATVRLKYSSAESVLNVLWLYSEVFCGVFGDPQNGGYE